MKRDGLVTIVERRGISNGIAVRCLSHPQLLCLVWKGPYWRRDCPLKCRPQGSDSQGNRDWRCLRVSTQASILIIPEEPWVLITVGGQSVDFLLDTGGTFSVLTKAPGPLSFWSTTLMGLSGWAKCYYFSHPLSCSWDSAIFLKFLIMPGSPLHLLGRDILNKVQPYVFINKEHSLFNWTKCKS